MIFLRSKFQDAYNKFTSEWHLFTARIAEFQEDTLMVLVTCKYIERWYEKALQVVEKIDYISAVQKDRDTEEHDLRVLRDNNIDHIRKSAEYINWVMRDIGLPEFGSPEDFVDLHDIVKQHEKQDSLWIAEIAKVENMAPGQVH
jgi:hypothetical protein